MRGDEAQLQPGMFSYIALEDRIPTGHPLRAVRQQRDLAAAPAGNVRGAVLDDASLRGLLVLSVSRVAINPVQPV